MLGFISSGWETETAFAISADSAGHNGSADAGPKSATARANSCRPANALIEADADTVLADNRAAGGEKIRRFLDDTRLTESQAELGVRLVFVLIAIDDKDAASQMAELVETYAGRVRWLVVRNHRDGEKLGMKGTCQLDHFERLCLGQHPVTGEKLLVRDKVGRRVCFFGQLSAPKDVSVALLVGGDTRLAGWWQDAVKETLTEMESVAAARVRRAGTNADRNTGNMIAAIVTHDASRALDPQLHTHVCVMNLTFDEVEQRWKGLQPDGLFRHQGYFREVCYNKLAERMLSTGYELERARGLGFTIKGFPAELRERFSKRRHAILKEAAAAGVTTQDALHTIAGHSRATKSKATARELTAGWRMEAGDALTR